MFVFRNVYKISTANRMPDFSQFIQRNLDRTCDGRLIRMRAVNGSPGCIAFGVNFCFSIYEYLEIWSESMME